MARATARILNRDQDEMGLAVLGDRDRSMGRAACEAPLFSAIQLARQPH